MLGKKRNRFQKGLVCEEQGGVVMINGNELVQHDIEELSEFLDSWLRMRGLKT